MAQKMNQPSDATIGESSAQSPVAEDNSLRQTPTGATRQQTKSISDHQQGVNLEIKQEIQDAKKKVMKILITTVILVVAVVAVHFVNLQSDFIAKSGEWLSKTLNISV